MNKQTFHTCLLHLCLLLLAACSKDLVDQLQSRQELNEHLYTQNNTAATARIRQIMYQKSNDATTERFKLVHISDVHLSSWSPSNHYQLPINLRQSIRFANQDALRINAIAITGDFISYAEKPQATSFMRSFATCIQQDNRIPTLICTGNHDSNIGVQKNHEPIMHTLFYKSEITNLLFTNSANAHLRQTEENYYYEDLPNPQGGIIRIIALDMIDQPSDTYNTLNYAIYSQTQIDWLGNVALKGMTEAHSVIILNHFPFQRRDTGASTYLCDGDYVHPWQMIPEIVEAFRGHTTLQKSYPDQFGGDSIHVDFDFSTSRADFICYLGGHIHANAHFEISGLSNEQPHLPKQQMIICTNQAPSERGVVYNRVEREEDKLSSNAFCIHAFDTQERKIYTTYFGAYQPADEPNYPEIQVLSY